MRPLSLAPSYAPIARPEPALIPITSANIAQLARMVQLSTREDPFSRSAAYFAMTGRKGLWIYGDDESVLITARHPNKDGRTLVFPPIGQDPAGIITKALADPRMPSGGLELARIGREDLALAGSLHSAGAGKPRAEGVLDWTYPVHVVSPAKVIERQGKDFNSFRGHLNRAQREGLTAEPVDVARHRPELTQAVHQWAEEKRFSGYTDEDLTSPTLSVLDLMDAGKLAIAGTLTRDASGRPIGFWLWENADGAAMSLARVALRRPGCAELGILATCEQVRSHGIDEFCLGGSESAELDTFKRKMQPVRSIELQSLTLRPGPANDHQPRAAFSARPAVLSRPR